MTYRALPYTAASVILDYIDFASKKAKSCTYKKKLLLI